jgi:aminopeptidase N
VTKRVPGLIALLLLAVACSPNTAIVPPGTTTTGLDSTTTSTAEATPTSPETTSTTTTPVDVGASPGAPGLGDPYFPMLGNGGYDVEHYTLELTVDPIEGGLQGEVTIEATATETLSAFNLDLVGLTVDNVTVDGAVASYSRDGGELTVVPPSVLPGGEAFAATISYGGIPEAWYFVSEPFPTGWRHTADGVYVVAEPDAARTWFPCNDHPSDKATYTFRITVPDPYVVAASGSLIEQTPAGDGEDAASTYVWEMTYPMATYLATIVVAEMDRVDRPGLPHVVVRDYLPTWVDASEVTEFSLSAEMIEYLETIYGPYPFDAYGHVLVPDLVIALETQSLSVFGDVWIGSDILEYVVVHELAHQWFGDCISPATWQDIWLNEGFAVYSEWMWIEHSHGRDAMLDYVEGVYSQVAHIDHPPPGDPGVFDLFNYESVYLRGALTLYALRAEVGDEVFFEIIRTYADTFAYGNATIDDFISLAETVSGRDLEDVFDGWLYDPTVPPLPELQEPD